jgi:hypothetical protein
MRKQFLEASEVLRHRVGKKLTVLLDRLQSQEEGTMQNYCPESLTRGRCSEVVLRKSSTATCDETKEALREDLACGTFLLISRCGMQ